MKTPILISIIVLALAATPLFAQQAQRPARLPARPNALAKVATNGTGDYSSDLATVDEAQTQALAQARQTLEQSENERDKTALAAAIKEMEHAEAALSDAKKSQEKLPAAIAAEQAAYQALLKLSPREFRMTRGRRGGQGGNQGGAQQRQLDQLEMQREENRYETERQASSAQSPLQREQLQTADKLKELAQRQQDLNERLRDLQSALQAARTEAEREDVQQQLKRLRDEQRQMLANVDEMRQQLAQSPNASSESDARQQLDQTRSDMERAAQEMDRQSASQALAAGTRAQQGMQNLRDDLRKQTANQFSDQMRDLRNDARELSRQQDEIAKKLDSLNTGDQQSLDNTAARREISDQLAHQQAALTNLLAKMRTVTEQSETSEPLLSQQLYDTLRHADQMQTDNLLQMGTQLVDRGFLPQASQAERSARTNLNELRQGVERAAESVLGSEADTLRFAEKELDDLARQVEQELGGGTNSSSSNGAASASAQTQSNRVARANGNQRSADQPGGNDTTNLLANADENQNTPASGNRAGQPRGEGNQPDAAGNRSGGQRADANQPNGTGGRRGQGNRAGGNRAAGDNNNSADNQTGLAGGPPSGEPNQDGSNTNGGGGDRLRQLVEQMGRGGDGGARGGANVGGPITGTNFVNWSDRLRDVERVLDPADLRTQLATVRERVGAYRSDYRDRRRPISPETVRRDILTPLTQVRVWLQEELARQGKSDSLVPLDRDPVPENYSESVRKYYEKLGSAQ